MLRIKILSLTLMIASTVGLALRAQDAGPAMDEILSHYQKIQQSLAADTLTGVKAEAQAIVQKTEDLLKQPTDLNEKSAIELRKIIEEVRDSARKLDTDDIIKARAAFGELSQPLVRYVKSFPTARDKYYVAYCPMAKRPWVQTEKAIKNPYYGKSMLTCGTIEKK